MAIIKHGNNALSSVTAFPSAVPTGKPVLLSTATASSSASIEFTSGIDSTYDIYKFELINIHPSTDSTHLYFNFSTDGGSNFNVTKTSTYFRAFQTQTGGTANLAYQAAYDQAQSTADHYFSEYQYNSNDASACATLFIFNPSSTTYVKHFIGEIQYYRSYSSENHATANNFTAGYCNTTSAVNAAKFCMSSGTIDAGTIKMYGISA